MRRLLISLACAGLPAAALAGQGTAVAGAWSAERYELASGVTHGLRGHIFFSDSEWSVLFFVLDGEGTPTRGSAEGGTYTLDGPRLVFTHLYHLSVGDALPGLPASPLRMEARPRGTGPEEPSTIDVTNDELTIFFPSGNAMAFRRLR